MMAKSPAVSPGEAVAPLHTGRLPETLNSERDNGIIIDEVGSRYELDLTGEKKWSTTASISNQFSQPGLWKPSSMKAAVFDLGDEKQLEAYNELLSGTHPAEAPKVIISTTRIEFWQGKHNALVHYQELLYRALIQKNI